MDENQGEKLQKVIAAHGLTSRRGAEALIRAGKVTVNGQVVTEQGLRVTSRDEIRVNGELLSVKPSLRYILLHKPAGWITSMADENGRRTVCDLLTDVPERVYPVGRLDYDTSGLLLLTNDGELANRLTHPSHNVEKNYSVLIKGKISNEAIKKLRDGVELSDGQTSPAKVRRLREKEQGSIIEITIHEGRNRQIRRMVDAVGYEVIHLKRIALANLNLTDLPLGKYRDLTDKELALLKQIAGIR
ncbi:MAG: pseudouridine synthase [Clostridia bacterium]|nr:pseudouridine synthase [Clostridia bacterium]